MLFFSINFYCSTVALQCCYLLLHSKLNQPCIYVPSFPLRFPSHLGHQRALSRLPVLYSKFQTVVYFIHSINSVFMSIPVSQFLPPYSSPPPPLGIHTFVLYLCVSVSALQIRSSVPFFWTPHMGTNMWYLFFSFWFTSVCVTLSRSIHTSPSFVYRSVFDGHVAFMSVKCLEGSLAHRYIFFVTNFLSLQ